MVPLGTPGGAWKTIGRIIILFRLHHHSLSVAVTFPICFCVQQNTRMTVMVFFSPFTLPSFALSSVPTPPASARRKGMLEGHLLLILCTDGKSFFLFCLTASHLENELITCPDQWSSLKLSALVTASLQILLYSPEETKPAVSEAGEKLHVSWVRVTIKVTRLLKQRSLFIF